MCVIIIKDNDKIINRETLMASSIINPDGLGILWLDTYKVEKMDSKEWEMLRTKRPFIAHFRYATVGKVDISNCHPFNINKDNILFQNGTVCNLGNKNMTDTQHLANILNTVKPKSWREVLEMNDSRFVIADTKNKSYSIYNKEDWYDKNGILYSKLNVLDKHLIAVYGTLKQGGSNYYSYLMDSKYIGEGETYNKYPLIIEGLPYLLSKKGKGHNVEVDVFLVDSRTLKTIDSLEGHPHWYKRQRTPIEIIENGSILHCWAYFNDTVEDTGVYHHSYETENTRNRFGGWNEYDDYSYENYYTDNGSMECECGEELMYDDREIAYFCIACNEYTTEKMI